MQDKDLVALMVDVGNQPAFVAADIKPNAYSNVVRIFPSALNVPEMLPIGCCVLDGLVPSGQGSRPLGVHSAGSPNLPSADNAHNKSSRFAKIAPRSNLFGSIIGMDHELPDGQSPKT
jgi:hypothetical protein